MNEMYSISLYEFESPNIKISLDASFNKKNQLVLDGYDIGKTVRELRGDSDYEYHYTIDSAEVEKIATILNTSASDKDAFLQELKNRFHGNEAFSKFGAFMRANNIRFEQFSW